MIKLGQSRRSHDEVKSLSAKHFIVFQLLYLFSSEVLKYTRGCLPLLLFAMQITQVLFFQDIRCMSLFLIPFGKKKVIFCPVVGLYCKSLQLAVWIWVDFSTSKGSKMEQIEF